MNDFYCPQCQNRFDDVIQQPRMFPNCGHTFCSTCILSLIDLNLSIGQASCFDRNDKCPNFKYINGINSFPINKFILNHIKGRKTEQPLKEAEHLTQVCREHSKPLDIICETDATKICSDCALFGAHKSHRFMSASEFLSLVKEKLRALENEINKLDSKPFAKDLQTDLDILYSTINKRRDACLELISMQFDNLISEITKKKNDAIQELADAFQKFDEFAKDLSIKGGEIIEKQKVLGLKVNDAKKQTTMASCSSELIAFFFPDEELKNDAQQIELELAIIEKTLQNEIYTKLERIQIQSSMHELAGPLASFLTVSIELPIKFQGFIKDEKIGKMDQNRVNKLESNKNSKANIFLSNEDFENSFCPFSGITNPVPELPLNSIEVKKQIFKQNPLVENKATPKNRLISFLKRVNPESQTKKDRAAKLPRPEKEYDILFDKIEVESQESLSNSGKIKKSHSAKSKSLLYGKRKFNYEPRKADQSENEPEEYTSKKDLKKKRKRSMLPFKGTQAKNGISKPQEKSPNFLKRNQQLETHSALMEQLEILSTKCTPKPEDIYTFELTPDKGSFEDSSESIKQRQIKLKSRDLNPRPIHEGEQANNSKIPLETLLDRSGYYDFSKLGVFSSRGTHTSQVNYSKTANKSSLMNISRNADCLSKLEVFESRLKPSPENKLPIALNKRKSAVINSKASTMITENFEKWQAQKKGTLLGNNFQLKAFVTAKQTLPNENLLELSYENQKLNDSTLIVLVPKIIEAQKARVLNLANNFITDVGVEMLIRKLAAHPTLESIILRQNYVEDRIFDFIRIYAKNLKRINHFCFLENNTLKDRNKIKLLINELRKLNIRIDV